LEEKLSIGITAWNSQLFLGSNIRAIRENTRCRKYEIVVLDNFSEDQSAEIAKRLGARVLEFRCNQADAMNYLLDQLRFRYVLLLHSDVVLLSENWLEICLRHVTKPGVALVSPEDIGCGPMTRSFGVGKPESSFLFMDMKKMEGTRIYKNFRKFYVPYWRRLYDFYGPHVTHNIPLRLAEHGLTWDKMRPLISQRYEKPFYVPNFQPRIWSDELSHLKYGLGNFYVIDDVITHYHNWYERVDLNIDPQSQKTTEPNGDGFPLTFVKNYTCRFLADYKSRKVEFPAVDQHLLVPKALQPA
jgi:glycosyltransferase involved in cell wall biosynthesis